MLFLLPKIAARNIFLFNDQVEFMMFLSHVWEQVVPI